MNDPDGTGATNGESGSPEEPEQLLSEALRAQARSAPDAARSAGPERYPAMSADPPPPGYGLLSGAEAGSLERERAALDDVQGAHPLSHDPASAGPENNGRVRPFLPAPWVLLLAVVLGLAAGSVVGMLTLL